MIRGQFNLPSFYKGLDAIRIRRGLTWNVVGKQTGLNPDFFHALRDGRKKNLHVDVIATLALWSGLNINDFVQAEQIEARPEPDKRYCLTCKSELSAFWQRDLRNNPHGGYWKYYCSLCKNFALPVVTINDGSEAAS